MPEFTDMVALVTGGSKGIGRAISLELAKSGADVIVNYHSEPDEAEETCRIIRDFGRQAVLESVDVADRSAVFAMIERARERFGRVDLLVNNAACQFEKDFEQTTADDWDRSWRVSVMGAVHCCQAVIPAMRRRGFGRIVNISSIAGLRGSGGVHYSTAKAALLGLTMSLAREVGGDGITINAVAPGLIDTPTLHRLMPDAVDEAKRTTLPGRLGRPEEIASAVVLLMANPYITGETLIVSGGRLMYP